MLLPIPTMLTAKTIAKMIPTARLIACMMIIAWQ